MTDGITPSQTVGPYFAYALTPEDYEFEALVGDNLRTSDVRGQFIRIEGRVLDGEGALVPDAMIEIWQADGEGRYAGGERGNREFTGFGRCETKGGVYSFDTIMPGAVQGADGRLQAPHINIGVFARGVLRRLFTRLYFEGEKLNAEDAVLESRAGGFALHALGAPQRYCRANTDIFLGYQAARAGRDRFLRSLARE